MPVAVTDDGVRISYTVEGQGKLPLILLHGWGGAGSGHSWAEMLKHVDRRDFRIVAMDLRGHGQSEETSRGFTSERFGQDVLAVADHAGLRRFVLVAFSMSGRWAHWVAAHAPERVMAQFLIAPAPPYALALTDLVLEQWISAGKNGWAAVVNFFVKAPLGAETLEGYSMDVAHTPELSLRRTYEMCRTAPSPAELKSTTVPTLVIAGKSDPILSPDFVREQFSALAPGARFLTLDCGHEIPLEKPLELAAILQAFCCGLSAYRPRTHARSKRANVMRS